MYIAPSPMMLRLASSRTNGQWTFYFLLVSPSPWTMPIAVTCFNTAMDEFFEAFDVYTASTVAKIEIMQLYYEKAPRHLHDPPRFLYIQ